MVTTGETSYLGLALSGGGHRAAAWALGALSCLADTERSRLVRHVSSVSGGSIANAYVGMHTRYDEIGGDAFARDVTATLAPILASRSTLFGSPVAMAATTAIAGGAIGMLGSALAVIGAGLGLPLPGSLAGAAFAGSAAIAYPLFRHRGDLCAHTFDRMLFRGAPLSRLSDSAVNHVLCATDLQFAEHVYLSGRFVYAWRLGVGSPTPLSLATAVQASASFPFGFPAKVIPTHGFGFRHHVQPPGEQTRLPERLMLIDGGVYDNMADEWLVGLAARLSPDAPARDDEPANARARADALRSALSRPGEVPRELLIVNASPSYPRADYRPNPLGVGEEVATALRVMNALHDNSTSRRRQSLVRDFAASERTGKGTRGTLVHIATSPLDAITDARERAGAPPDRVARASAALDFVRDVSPERDHDALAREWRERARANSRVGTTLWALGVEAVSNLLWHAYVLTAVQSHVYLGHALPPIDRARRDRFGGLAQGRA